MKTSGKFVASYTSPADIDCNVVFAAKGQRIHMEVSYLITLEPPYRYRHCKVEMSFREAAYLAERIIGSMKHVYGQAEAMNKEGV